MSCGSMKWGKPTRTSTGLVSDHRDVIGDGVLPDHSEVVAAYHESVSSSVRSSRPPQAKALSPSLETREAARRAWDIRRQAHAEHHGVKPVQKQREDLWEILDALHTSRWRVNSVDHSLQRLVWHDGYRWHVSANFIPMVESREGHPGFAGTVGAWSNRAERLKRSSPITTRSVSFSRRGIGVSPRRTTIAASGLVPTTRLISWSRQSS